MVNDTIIAVVMVRAVSNYYKWPSYMISRYAACKQWNILSTNYMENDAINTSYSRDWCCDRWATAPACGVHSSLMFLSLIAVVNLLSLLFVAITGYIGDVYSAPLIIISKVYANSILVLLNNRMSIDGSRNAMPQPIKSVEISRSSEFISYNPRYSEFNPYNSLQGATLTGSQAAHIR